MASQASGARSVASNVTNRSTIRDLIADLLDTALVGLSKPVDEVVTAIPSDITRGTVVAVSSLGSDRKKLANRDVISKSSFYFEVFIYVATAEVTDDNDAIVWDEYSAEDQVDLVEKMIADVIIDNNTNPGTYMQISYAERTETDHVIVTEEYRRERIRLIVEVENA
jgi:hypothetical protein